MKKGRGVFFSTTGTAVPKYWRSSSFSFEQLPVEAKKKTNNKRRGRTKERRTENKTVLWPREYESSYKEASQNSLEPNWRWKGKKKLRQLFSHKWVVRKAKHIKVRKT